MHCPPIDLTCMESFFNTNIFWDLSLCSQSLNYIAVSYS